MFVPDKHIMCLISYSSYCDSVGVIYVLRCISCFKIYVGNSVPSFSKRSRTHKSFVKEVWARWLENGCKYLANICMPII